MRLSYRGWASGPLTVGNRTVAVPGRLLGTLVLLSVLVTGCAHQRRAPAHVPHIATQTCLPAGITLAHVRPLHPNARQRAEYLASYRNPFVVGLRTDLDAYAGGRAQSAPWLVETAHTLKPFGKALARDHFTVLSLDPDLFGGEWITIRFTHHPKAAYHAWVYFLSGSASQPSLRALRAVPCTSAEQAWMAIRYARFFALGDDSTLMTQPRRAAPAARRRAQ